MAAAAGMVSGRWYMWLWGGVVLGTLIAVFTQRCPFCHRYLGMMFFSGKKMYCPHCGSDVHADRNV